jgi:hypothetical protein
MVIKSSTGWEKVSRIYHEIMNLSKLRKEHQGHLLANLKNSATDLMGL